MSKLDETKDPPEPFLADRHRIDFSVAGSFLQGQVASLSPNIVAVGIETRPHVAKQSNFQRMYVLYYLYNITLCDIIFACYVTLYSCYVI
jgi:hypothetical protein